MYNRENVILRSNFQNRNFDGFTHFEDKESENHVLSGCFVHECVISITETPIIAETQIFLLYFCLVFRCYLKL